jgi:hypothetical protein
MLGNGLNKSKLVVVRMLQVQKGIEASYILTSPAKVTKLQTLGRICSIPAE